MSNKPYSMNHESRDNSGLTRRNFLGATVATTVAMHGLADWAVAEEPPFHPGSTTLAVIPDTEVYANKRPHIFNAMMKWVADNKDKRNINYLLHVGDVTNNNTKREWRNARKAFDFIEGKIPYVLAAGNHDYDHTPGRLTYMNEFFKVEDLKKWPTFGDVYEPGKLENHYQFLEIHGRKWIVLSLEMGPRKAVIEWANKVISENKDRMAIILTHGYLYYGNARYDHRKGGQRASPYNYYGEGADGEMLWNQLVRKHPNVMMVICGHLSSAYVGYRADEADYGNTAHQMMCDYEKMKGGRGFLRLLEFLPDGKTVKVWTYSPVTGGRNPINPKLEEFSFKLQEATRDEPKQVAETPAKPLKQAPIHRYSFDGTADQKELKDSIGGRNGELANGASLNGEGQLVLADNKSFAKLPPNLLQGKNNLSFEVWFTPTTDHYRWSSVVRFGGGRDWFTYVMRNFTTHRAEITVNRYNQDIQLKRVPMKVGKQVQVVVTYNAEGANGSPLLSYYRDGEKFGQMRVSLKLSDIKEMQGMVGPFAGKVDELRIFDYPLSPNEVANNFNVGPNKIKVECDK